MNHNAVRRRDFFKVAVGGFGAFSLSSAEFLSADNVLTQAQNSIDNLKITDIKYLDMEFPGKLPVKWNSIITSGGGSPKLTQLEIYTNQGIIGRSIPKGSRSIVRSLFKKIKGECLT